MKAAEITKLTVEELEDQVDHLRTELFNLRVQNTTKELQNTSRIRQARRDLARILTALNDKGRPEATAAQ